MPSIMTAAPVETAPSASGPAPSASAVATADAERKAVVHLHGGVLLRPDRADPAADLDGVARGTRRRQNPGWKRTGG